LADSTSRQQAEALVERALALAGIRRWKDAEAYARRALAADPTYVRAQLTLAHVRTSQGALDEGRTLAERALGQDPTSSWALRLASHIATREGRYTVAIDLADSAVGITSGDELSLIALTQALRAAQRLDEAADAADQLRTAYPDSAEAHYQVALTRASHEEAAEAYRAALAIDPAHDRAAEGLASVSGELALYSDRVSLAWSALRADPANKGRQRGFTRAAWAYLIMSRIARPWRSGTRALAERFGEPCAAAFNSTGRNTFRRLLFAFPQEAILLATWVVLLVASLVVVRLPLGASVDWVREKLPLATIFYTVGLFVLVLGTVASVRRLLLLRIEARAGDRRSIAVIAKVALSGLPWVVVGLVGIIVTGEGDATIPWAFTFCIGAILGFQDLEGFLARRQDRERKRQPGVRPNPLANPSNPFARFYGLFESVRSSLEPVTSNVPALLAIVTAAMATDLALGWGEVPVDEMGATYAFGIALVFVVFAWIMRRWVPYAQIRPGVRFGAELGAQSAGDLLAAAWFLTVPVALWGAIEPVAKRWPELSWLLQAANGLVGLGFLGAILTLLLLFQRVVIASIPPRKARPNARPSPKGPT
jgi:tetratricopeptide (TPR) repeat protein